jgi:hypothetical protein
MLHKLKAYAASGLLGQAETKTAEALDEVSLVEDVDELSGFLLLLRQTGAHSTSFNPIEQRDL